MGCLGFHGFTFHWLISSIRMGIGMQEGRSGVTQVVSYLDYPGLSERGNFIGGDSLIPYLVVFANSCVRQLVICYSRYISFEMDASTIKSLMSGTYTTILC